MREDPPPEVTVATVVAARQASAGARDGVKVKRNDLAARAPLHALVRRQRGSGASRRDPNHPVHISLVKHVGSRRHIAEALTLLGAEHDDRGW